MASATFQKSNRLRELLLYLGTRSMHVPSPPIHEQELGTEIFERAANYDTGQDPIVRVQISQLRKRLSVYFSEEGWDEPLLIEIPRGSYTLEFTPRPTLERAVLDKPTRHFSKTSWILAAVALTLLVTTSLFAWQNRQLRKQSELGLGPHPTVSRLWKQLFGNGFQTYVALADGALVVYEDEVSRQLPVQAYEKQEFYGLARDRIADPAIRDLVLSLLGWSFTGLGDANLARRLDLISAPLGIPLSVILARSLSTQQVSTQNTILFGSRRANPWISLFEDQLNFQTLFKESPRAALFLNRKPQAGEQTTYAGEWSKLGYCRVAYLANPEGTGTTLLISGTSVASTEAGGDYLTSEDSLRALRSKLKLSPHDRFPHFEILLRVKIVNNATSEYKVVALRRH